MQTTNQQCGTFNDLVTACENLHKFTRLTSTWCRDCLSKTCLGDDCTWIRKNLPLTW